MRVLDSFPAREVWTQKSSGARNLLVPVAAFPRVHVSVASVLNVQLLSMPYFISTRLSSPFLVTRYLTLFLHTCPTIHKPGTKALTLCMQSVSQPQQPPPTSLHLHTTSPPQHPCFSFSHTLPNFEFVLHLAASIKP